jgi:uncharacterized protein (DUF885 family)
MELRKRKEACWISVVALVSFGLASCGREAPRPAASQQPGAPATWSQFVDGYLEQYFELHPTFAVMAGRHEFDGRLPDWSADGIKNLISKLEGTRVAALEFGDQSLSIEQRFQRDYLVATLDEELFWVRDAEQPFTNPAFYFDNGIDPSTYVTVPYAPVDERARAFIKYAQAVPDAAAQIRANLRTPMPSTFIEFAIAGFAGLADFYRNDVPQAFAEVTDAQIRSDLTSAIEPAAKAMDELAAWLESERPRASDTFALGPEKFAAMLQMTERVTTPLEKLREVGQRDLDRNLAALASACKRFAPGSIQSCVAKVAAQKPADGPVAEAQRQLPSLRQFVIDHELVSIPGTEEALVNEAPAYKSQNSAYIEIPGPYEKNLPSVYYIAPPDPKWTKEEQAAYIPGTADLLFTSVHEVWPGHFLQFLHSNRSSWRYGQLFVGYAFAEGWAHYTEELMIEAGLAKDDPAAHVGQLLNALLRNVRFMCAIGLHTQGMTVAQCERLFREKAYQDPGNARQQAARGTYDPAYLNYTLGKLMIMKLRADWQAARGERATLKKFHDELLSYGGPPIPLLRQQMLDSDSGELF